jgi:hypothetical protein
MAADENRIQRPPTLVDSICSCKSQKKPGRKHYELTSAGVLKLSGASIWITDAYSSNRAAVEP